MLEQNDNGSARVFGTGFLVNMSIWTDKEALAKFVYHSAHALVMSRRKEWFTRMTEVYSVLWWVPEGHIPSLEEAAKKLRCLRLYGPSPEAFTFKEHFPPGQ